MEISLQLLEKAYDALAQIFVRGEDVFRMADARQTIKAAYSVIRKEVQDRANSEQQNVVDGDRDPTA